MLQMLIFQVDVKNSINTSSYLSFEEKIPPWRMSCAVRSSTLSAKGQLVALRSPQANPYCNTVQK